LYFSPNYISGETHRRRGRGEGVPAHSYRQFISIISFTNILNSFIYD
jgi:hypothetical protein